MTDILFKSFNNKALLNQALTHRSWVHEHQGERESNERLEFLGDAVLELVVSKAIFNKFLDKEEGYLTVLRASLVNTENLAKVAQKLDIGKYLYLSKGEEPSGRRNKTLLANTVEAIIGAIFLDGGLGEAEKFITKYLLADLPKKVNSPLKDAKSLLQEFVQNKGLKPPTYKVIKSYGPDHAKIFVVEVVINAKSVAKASGHNKSAAAQKAAGAALLKLKRK